MQTPLIGHLNQRTKTTSTSSSTTKIPVLTTQPSTYEQGESSRRPKRSKRPALQSRTPIVFNLDDDDHVRKVYDKYVGISEGNYICSFLIIL